MSSVFDDPQECRRLWLGYLYRLAIGEVKIDKYDFVRMYCYGITSDHGGKPWRLSDEAVHLEQE